MSQGLTDKACKAIINHLARKLNVSAKLIMERLLSEDDKNDLRYGNLSIESLECHIKAWKTSKFPSYLNLE